MSRAPLLCWIVVNSVPYHEARARAAANANKLRLCMVQITEVDEFRALQLSSETQLFARYTLFPGRPRDLIDGRDMATRLRACLSEIRPAVVCINGWSFGGAAAALAWCLSHRVPAVVMSESTAWDEPRRWWKEAVKRRIVSLCSAALVGGSPHLEYMLALGLMPDRIFTGYDVVDNEYFRAGAEAARKADARLRAELALPGRYFMACSRFTQKKNLHRLIHAYALYQRTAGPSAWSLVIVGEGELRENLIALRDSLGLQALIQFRGAKGYDELPVYYGLAGAFVHSSTTEQWGLVINEAMASGLPVIVSRRCGAARDLVNSSVNGFLFDPHDVHELATAMYDVAVDGCDRAAMGRASQTIVAQWSPDRFADSLAQAAEMAMGAAVPAAGVIDRTMLWMLKQR